MSCKLIEILTVDANEIAILALCRPLRGEDDLLAALSSIV
jgi:hypothetical protein